MDKIEIIAEIGQNHNGDMVLAQELIHAALESGADVLKFQLYDAKKLFPKENNEWYDYNCKTELTKVQLCQLFEECKKTGVEFLASVFDEMRVGWLEEVGVKRYKVASRSIDDKSLIGKICDTGKPVIVSLGMWSDATFPIIPTLARVDYLYCISKYPAPLEDVHLSLVDFSKYAGFSDHTEGIHSAMAALARGAHIIEKHFTLDKKMYGPDHSCSMIPRELKLLDNFRKDLVKIL
jgi:sialic acid synthase SpsE